MTLWLARAGKYGERKADQCDVADPKNNNLL